MSKFFSTLFAMFAFIFVFVAAAPARNSNAERFKRGLPPLKPKNLYSPTRRQTGSNPVSSSAPAVRAVIKAYDMSDPSNPTFLGYVTSNGAPTGSFTYTSNFDLAVIVTPQLASLQPGNIPFENPPYNGYPELGFSGPYSDLDSGTANLVSLAGTTSTPKFSPPVSTPDQSFASGGNEPTESAVWYLVNAASGEIKPEWINSNGVQAPTYLVYFANPNYFAIAADPAYISQTYGPSAASLPIRFNLDTVDVVGGN